MGPRGPHVTRSSVDLGDKVCVFGAKVRWSHAGRGDKGRHKEHMEMTMRCFPSPGEDLFRGKVKNGEREQDVSGK